jgi:glucosamine-6-phosphate deaminase
LDSKTRVVRLSSVTRSANRGNFAGGEVPEAAVTMGLGTIRAGRRLLLLANGTDKADAIAAALEGPVTAGVPASALQLHGDVIVLLDAAAAAGLQRCQHYADEVELVRRLTPQRLGG